MLESKALGRLDLSAGRYALRHVAGGAFPSREVMNDYVTSHVDQVVSIHEYALYDQARYGFPGVNQQICWLDALDDCGPLAP